MTYIDRSDEKVRASLIAAAATAKAVFKEKATPELISQIGWMILEQADQLEENEQQECDDDDEDLDE